MVAVVSSNPTGSNFFLLFKTLTVNFVQKCQICVENEKPDRSITIYRSYISQVIPASMAQRAEHQIKVAEVLGSVLTGVTFYCWIFCFQIVKPAMPILPREEKKKFGNKKSAYPTVLGSC